MNQKLTPTRIINVEGMMYYNESNQSWGKIKLRKEIINEFPQLKEKRSKFSYKMLFFREYADFERSMKELIKKKEVLPILIWLERENDR